MHPIDTAGAPQHTPGPWQFYADLPSAEPNWHIVTNANRMRVLANVHIEPGNEMDLANARLIAAAPDLLAALRVYVAYDEYINGPDGDKSTNRLQIARAAITKITGSTS